MWDKIVDFLSDIGSPSPFVIINQYEKGVILRRGLYSRTLEPGFYLKIPFVDAVLTVEAVQTTTRIQPQSLTTKDGIGVTTSAVIRYEIKDPKAFLLEVYEGREAINDMALASIKKVIAANNWKDLNDECIEKEIVKEVRTRLNIYGVKVHHFGFADLARVRAFRFITDGGAPIDF